MKQIINKQDDPALKAKSLARYVEEKPAQLGLFELLLPEDSRYSNTVELYDFIPKYKFGKPERIQGKWLNQLVRQFECRGTRYTVEIKPASITDKDGVERYYYPGQREELVEDALRKFVCEGQGVFENGRAGVTFTLHQLQQELKSRGHSYSKDQIKHALLVMSQTGIIVKSPDGKALATSNLIENLALSSKRAGGKTCCAVRFNILVTQSIESLQFRQINYVLSMSLKSAVARQLYKRMSHHYTQASIQNNYTVGLLTLIRDFGLTTYKKLPNNLRDVKTALEELQEANVILLFKIDKITDGTKRAKLLDALLTITAHPDFANEMKKANRRKNDIDQQAQAFASLPKPVQNRGRLANR
jgi:hypothetical protein